ncbi:MAG: type I restriction endonuclease subunit R, partial [Thermoguttaceae bacterium]|nr:type I restriction endonuclease subunit R [Thermoguttaceae bacterium]
MLKNASYFAFTATPKNKTLQVFGEPFQDGDKKKFRPFHNYTMKQAIQEGFILDVLQNYITFKTAFQLVKNVDDDPRFDKRKAMAILQSFAENHPDIIKEKARLIVDHFLSKVATHKIGGQARAMVVTNSILHCLNYFYAIEDQLAAHQSPYKAIIAYSGSKKYRGKDITSEQINGFSEAVLPKKFKSDPYRILVVADMYQTGFDEPLLHTMYVDKPLFDIGAVQTLSRLNRVWPGKEDTFVLDFANDPCVIEAAFSRYYRTTLLANEADPDKLNQLIKKMEEKQVYTQEEVELIITRFINGAPRDQLDPILNQCASRYFNLDRKSQNQFKSAATTFVKAYNFLSSLLATGNKEWEKLNIFLRLLIPKLPSPPGEDPTEELLKVVDLQDKRVELINEGSLSPFDDDSEVHPVSFKGSGVKPEPEMELLSIILEEFNSQFGNIEWEDVEAVSNSVQRIIVRISTNEKYLNAMGASSPQAAQLESDAALDEVMEDILDENVELYKQYQDNLDFQYWLRNFVFRITYHKAG